MKRLCQKQNDTALLFPDKVLAYHWYLPLSIVDDSLSLLPANVVVRKYKYVKGKN